MPASSSPSSLQFRVLLFAGLRDALQSDFLVVSLATGSTPGPTVADLQRECEAQFPVLRAWLPYIRIAVNFEYSRPDTRLQEGDEIAFIPPVAGG
jgi:molybdopterin converting factor small subunit